MLRYDDLVGDRTLADLADLPGADAFSEVFWTLNETEHGTEAPDRLVGFRELLAHPGRTPALDRDLLLPWLVRYLWEVDFEAYTAAAWRTLRGLVDDEEDLAELAVDVLTHHPHGALRAEVITPGDAPPPTWLEEDPRITERAAHLARHDPSPRVRRAAFALDPFLGRWEEPGPILTAHGAHALAEDPCPTVRLAAFEALASARQVDRAATDAALLAALRHPANRPVPPRMLAAFGRARFSGRGYDPDLVAAVFDRIAEARGTPRYADVRRPLAWVLVGLDAEDGAFERIWRPAGPYGDGATLIARARGLWEDASAPVADRTHALTLLDHLAQPLHDDTVIAFLLDEAHTAASLDVAADAWFVLERIASVADPARLGVLAALLEHGRTRADAVDGRGAAFRRRVIDRAVRAGLRLPPTLGQPLIDLAVEAVVVDPTDVSFALYDLWRTPRPVAVVPGLLRAAREAADPHARRGAADFLARRAVEHDEPTAWAALARLLAETRTPSLVAQALGALRQVSPEARAALADALTWVGPTPPDDPVEAYAHGRVRRWLGEEANP